MNDRSEPPLTLVSLPIHSSLFSLRFSRSPGESVDSRQKALAKREREREKRTIGTREAQTEGDASEASRDAAGLSRLQRGSLWLSAALCGSLRPRSETTCIRRRAHSTKRPTGWPDKRVRRVETIAKRRETDPPLLLRASPCPIVSVFQYFVQQLPSLSLLNLPFARLQKIDRMQQCLKRKYQA